MKKFNITGLCDPKRHYMVNTSSKTKKILELIDNGDYFIINRPRQYGKTTMLSLLYKELQQRPDYLVIDTSFEGLGYTIFETEENFSQSIFSVFVSGLYNQSPSVKTLLKEIQTSCKTFAHVSEGISTFIQAENKHVVLLIDEVDKAGNYDVFINFLGILRNKYLKRDKEPTFHSVVLAGVHDIKNLKKKIRPDTEAQYNSPWNIATEFKIDLSFSAEEIESMLNSYFEPVDNRHACCPQELASEIHKFTSGYPFLVSKICKVIDEDLDKDWSIEGIQNAINSMLAEQNTLFDDMVKNIENNQDLYQLVQTVLLDSALIDFNQYNPVIHIGIIYGILGKNAKNKLVITNKVFEVFLYNYMVSKLEVGNYLKNKNHYEGNYLDSLGNLDMEKTLLRFQQFIKETYSDKEEAFYERHGRLLLIAFVKPIINGEGFYYIEPQQSYERRSDMIITFNKKEYILEFKLWHGQQYHEKGLEQLAGYLDSKGHTTGYLVAFNFNKNKEFSNQWNEIDGKKIFEVIV